MDENWTRRTPPVGLKRSAPPRRFQTAVRWTPQELDVIRRAMPAGVTLTSFVRNAALRSAFDSVDERGA